MDEQEKAAVTFDLEDWLSGETIIKFNIDTGGSLRLHFNEAVPEYQSEPSNPVEADLRLFDRRCIKVEIQNGEDWIDVPDFKTRISPEMKLRRFSLWRGTAAQSATRSCDHEKVRAHCASLMRF